jgi:hypothetical protein
MKNSGSIYHVIIKRDERKEEGKSIKARFQIEYQFM